MANLLKNSLFPRLAHSIPRSSLKPSALPHRALSFSRLLATNSSPPRPSFSFSSSSIPKRFPSPAASTSRGLSTAPLTASQPVDWTKVASSVGIATVAAVGLNYALNRETRGALTDAESSYLNETFQWTAGGIAITAGVAKLLHSTGGAVRLMSMNPWVFMGVGLVASIGTMYGVYATEPGTAGHYTCWALFSGLQGVTLSPMFFLNPAILSRAGLYTVGALGGLTYVGATAQNETFLYIGGPLLAGLGVVLVSSLAPMIMPRMALRTLSVLEHVSAYGGVAVFSGFILYDTQKILKHAQMAQRGIIQRDPIRESVSLILDAINLFVRIVQVMLLQQRKK